MREDDQCVSPSVHTKAENIKKALTYSLTAEFNCTIVSNNNNNNNQFVKFEVTREDFEVGCSYLFQRGLAPVVRLLNDLGYCYCCYC